jgi:hypothetical protein
MLDMEKKSFVFKVDFIKIYFKYAPPKRDLWLRREKDEWAEQR